VPDTTTIETEGFGDCEVELSGKPVMVALLIAVFVGMKLEVLKRELDDRELDSKEDYIPYRRLLRCHDRRY
jgi:hypothetical protein